MDDAMTITFSRPTNMYFYIYAQNNAGGNFITDCERGISQAIFIEESTPEKANKKAMSIGLYFDGVENGIDCGCCGDRWYRAWNASYPAGCFSISRFKSVSLNKAIKRDLYFVHRANGEIERIDFREGA